MAKLTDPGVAALVEPANYATISTPNEDGSITSSIVWFNVEDGVVCVNGATGRRWTDNLVRSGTVALLVADPQNPYDYVEVRGSATRDGGPDEGHAHIDRLANRYIGKDYPWLSEGEERARFTIDPSTIRHQKQG